MQKICVQKSGSVIWFSFKSKIWYLNWENRESYIADAHTHTLTANWLFIIFSTMRLLQISGTGHKSRFLTHCTISRFVKLAKEAGMLPGNELFSNKIMFRLEA